MLTFLKDLGMKYQTAESKGKRRMYLVYCSGCEIPFEVQAGQFKAGYTNWCKPCGLKNNKAVV